MVIVRKILKYFIFRLYGIKLDFKSNLNSNVELSAGFKSATIINSNLQISKMGNGCFIERAVSFGNIELGRYVSISGPGTILHAGYGKIKIGNFCSIAQNVSIQEFNHDYNRASTFAMNFFFFTRNFNDDVVSKGDIIIEDDVWIGSNVVILSGVHIGRGCVIGAGSVVTKSIPAYSIVVGNPARVLKKRFSDSEIDRLEQSHWWSWSDGEIYANKDFFSELIINE